MKEIRNLVIAWPKLCGVDQYKRWAKKFELVYDYEAKNRDSEFSRQPGEDFIDRIEVFMGVGDVAKDFETHEFIVHLLHFASLSIDNNTGIAVDKELLGKLEKKVLALSDDYPEVTSILSVATAAKALGWAPA